jgi:transposase
MKTLPQPWTAAMEATIFTAWIYDHLLPHAAALKVAHPLMLRAIAAAKKKNDRIDANKIADCLRCDFLPECYIASTEIRERRRTLRYRNLLVHQAVQMMNKISGLLMETGVSYNKQKLHKVGYFRELLATNKDIDDGLRPLLRLCRETLVRLGKTESALLRSLGRDPLLVERVERLMTIPAVGPVTALTWVLEVGDARRFSSIKKAISYCGLCGAEKSSADARSSRDRVVFSSCKPALEPFGAFSEQFQVMGDSLPFDRPCYAAFVSDGCGFYLSKAPWKGHRSGHLCGHEAYRKSNKAMIYIVLS